MKIEKKQLNMPLCIIMAAAPFVSGLFYVWSACLVSIAIAILLWKRGQSFYIKSKVFYGCAVVVLCYLITALWAVDQGMALLGFAKALALPLFAALFAQSTEHEQRTSLQILPYLGGSMVVLSFLLGQIPAWKSLFFVNQRLSGFFQYSNTFALFLLLGIVVLGYQKERKKIDWICLIILLLGIILSGSRTTFFLLVGLTIWLIIRVKEEKARRHFATSFAAVLLFSIIFSVATGNTAAIGRFLTASLSSSTLLGRLLYFKDAIPVILKHPFGLGYLGYYFSQGSFQTGVYSVRFIHNELLQLLLDIGLLPTLALCVIIVRRGCSHSMSERNRILAFAILLHSIMDFDLQYPAIGFVLIVSFMENEEIAAPRKKAKKSSVFPAALVIIICLYFGIASAFESAGNSIVATKVYPLYTDAQIELLQSAETAEEMERYANAILCVNQHSFIAYDAKAMVAYANADFTNVIVNKEKAIELNPYDIKEYEDYCAMLVDGIKLYEYYGDRESRDICRERICGIPSKLFEVEQQTSDLAWKINDKPDLQLSAETKALVEYYG